MWGVGWLLLLVWCGGTANGIWMRDANHPYPKDDLSAVRVTGRGGASPEEEYEVVVSEDPKNEQKLLNYSEGILLWKKLFVLKLKGKPDDRRQALNRLVFGRRGILPLAANLDTALSRTWISFLVPWRRHKPRWKVFMDLLIAQGRPVVDELEQYEKKKRSKDKSYDITEDIGLVLGADCGTSEQIQLEEKAKSFGGSSAGLNSKQAILLGDLQVRCGIRQYLAKSGPPLSPELMKDLPQFFDLVAAKRGRRRLIDSFAESATKWLPDLLVSRQPPGWKFRQTANKPQLLKLEELFTDEERWRATILARQGRKIE